MEEKISRQIGNYVITYTYAESKESNMISMDILVMDMSSMIEYQTSLIRIYPTDKFNDKNKFIAVVLNIQPIITLTNNKHDPRRNKCYLHYNDNIKCCLSVNKIHKETWEDSLNEHMKNILFV